MINKSEHLFRSLAGIMMLVGAGSLNIFAVEPPVQQADCAFSNS